MVAIVATMAVAMLTYFDSLNSSLQTTNTTAVATQVKENLIAVLDNDAAWIQTVANNPSMACLRTNGAICDSAAFGEIAVFEGDGSLWFDANPKKGFDVSGQPCDTFGDNDGNRCVFRFSIRPECLGGSCTPTELLPGALIATKPKIRVTGQFTFARTGLSSRSKLNPTLYSFDLTRGNAERTLSKFCSSVDGLFDQFNSRCKSLIGDKDTFDCTQIVGPGGYFVGYAPDGTPKCDRTAMFAATCPKGSAVVGLGYRGNLICGPF
jgi:hypothetical protein